MIQNDLELKVTQERILYFQGLLAQFRRSAGIQEFPALSGAYIAEVERMHHEVMAYLTRHVSQPVPAESKPARAPALAS